MKKLLALLLALVLVAGLAACGGGTTPDPTPEPAQETTPAPAPAETADEDDANEGPFNIPVIIKATDSDYWQILASGALRFAAENPDLANVTILGPPSEIDIDQQVTILENTIATNPDAIVIASTSSVATVPAIEQAMNMGIPVITLDNRVETDNFTSFLATNHGLASGLAAERMYETWLEEGIDPSGQSVMVISSVAGTAVNTARTNGFIDRMRELVPDINVLETQFADNDIARAMDIALGSISANPNLIGIFGDNNHMGVGIALAIEELNRPDIVTFAFDANLEQVNAIHAGWLTGIVVQDPFGMGFNGVDFAVRTILGETVTWEVVVPTTLVTLANVNDADIQEMLSYHLPS